eukprot:3670810-Rhodomonas_salina.1
MSTAHAKRSLEDKPLGGRARWHPIRRLSTAGCRSRWRSKGPSRYHIGYRSRHSSSYGRNIRAYNAVDCLGRASTR